MKSIVEFIKKITPRPIIDHLIYLIIYRLFRRSYFAQSSLDKKLKKYINYNDGYFVELGANDGFTASNTLYFELKKNWRGVLVEPSPNLYLSCSYYRNRIGNKIFCNACVPFDFNEKYVEIDYGYLQSVSKNLEKDIPEDFIQNTINSLDNEYTQNLRFGSVARTLSSILDESKAPQTIDLLSLDAEGAELAILKGIDFKKYKFKFMLIESRSLETLTEYLSQYGYHQIDQFSHRDYLFALK
jgi:FkbM family methyltransferase